MFALADDQLRSIKSFILKEFELGLSDEDSATIKMLITYVRELARGDESGSYLALDLGGTHFRVLLVTLGEGKPKVVSSIHDIPHDLLVTQQGFELFDYIALKLLEFVQQHKLKRKRISLGFTFSFPCKQYGLTQSVLVKWCKGFSVGGVIGTDVVRQLKDALKRQLAGLVEAYVDVVAVINDTTGTLVACAHSNKDCRIGLIVGTGFNACYMERLDRCEKWPANYTSPKQVIVNCEWGAMGDNKNKRELDPFRNEFDSEIDANSINPRNQTYEKMVAGMYVGELLRLSMLKLFKSKLLFPKVSDTKPDQDRTSGAKGNGTESVRSAGSASQTPPTSASSVVLSEQPSHKLYVKDVLNGRHLSMLATDELSGNYIETTKVLKELNIANYDQKDLDIVIKLGSKIIQRSADLVACGVSALLERMKRKFTVIGYDGSMVRFHPYFLRKVNEKCAQLTPAEFKFEFMQSSDGSGIGAAVVAAALHKERRPLYVLKPGRLYEMHFSKSQQHADGKSQASPKSKLA